MLVVALVSCKGGFEILYIFQIQDGDDLFAANIFFRGGWHGGEVVSSQPDGSGFEPFNVEFTWFLCCLPSAVSFVVSIVVLVSTYSFFSVKRFVTLLIKVLYK